MGLRLLLLLVSLVTATSAGSNTSKESKLVSPGNEAGSVPLINLKGYVLESPMTDTFTDSNSKVPFAHRLTLISDQLYESAKTSCNSNFVNVDSSNYQCSSDIDAIDAWLFPESNEESLLESHNSAPWCGAKTVSANQSATSGRMTSARLGSRTLLDSGTQLGSARRATRTRALISVVVSWSETEMILNKGETKFNAVRYTKKIIIDDFSLTYATAKGGGHNAAEDMVKECAAMIDRWMAYFPL
ncbi:serine carboxypeptidase-like 13 [Carya illinoinensis]|uniref:serine carboxypeptidase-like 13 n=1 Tax=Carya illinoinensis TaxID=32201 RepID=UPI001C71A01D|nr:serine carboxypeptidase-like 13 [Carya illinoinensis]